MNLVYGTRLDCVSAALMGALHHGSKDEISNSSKGREKTWG